MKWGEVELGVLGELESRGSGLASQGSVADCSGQGAGALTHCLFMNLLCLQESMLGNVLGLDFSGEDLASGGLETPLASHVTSLSISFHS